MQVTGNSILLLTMCNQEIKFTSANAVAFTVETKHTLPF